MPDYTASLKVQVKTKDNMAAFTTKVEAALRAWVTETAMLIEQYAKDSAEVNIGELRDSIHANVTSIMKAVVSTSCGYGLYIEKGTDPHWPPPGPLKLWAQRVLGDERLGFVVARAIAERGTDAQPFLYPAYERALNEQLPKLRAMFP